MSIHANSTIRNFNHINCWCFFILLRFNFAFHQFIKKKNKETKGTAQNAVESINIDVIKKSFTWDVPNSVLFSIPCCIYYGIAIFTRPQDITNIRVRQKRRKCQQCLRVCDILTRENTPYCLRIYVEPIHSYFAYSLQKWKENHLLFHSIFCESSLPPDKLINELWTGINS